MNMLKKIWDNYTPTGKQNYLISNRLFIQKYETIEGIEYVVFSKHNNTTIVKPLK